MNSELEAALDDLVRRGRAHLERLLPEYDVYKRATAVLHDSGKGTKHDAVPSFEDFIRLLVQPRR